MWMCLRSPDGWQSATRFSRLGGIRNNHFLTSKPEATCVVCVFVCVLARTSQSHTLLPKTSAAGRGGELTFQGVFAGLNFWPSEGTCRRSAFVLLT